MNKIVDARGMNCPHPVILTKKAMDVGEFDLITTLVDRDVAKENVLRLARSQGYDCEVEQSGDEYRIQIKRQLQAGESTPETGDIAILIKSRLFGEGEEALGEVLMRSFIYALNELDENLQTIVLMNSGVFLALENSPVLEHFKGLQARGVEILSCGTCLDYYQKTHQLAVGTITNMYTATEILTRAAKTLTI